MEIQTIQEPLAYEEKVEGKENAEGQDKAFSHTESSVSENFLKRTVRLFGNQAIRFQLL